MDTWATAKILTPGCERSPSSVVPIISGFPGDGQKWTKAPDISAYYVRCINKKAGWQYRKGNHDDNHVVYVHDSYKIKRVYP